MTHKTHDIRLRRLRREDFEEVVCHREVRMRNRTSSHTVVITLADDFEPVKVLTDVYRDEFEELVEERIAYRDRAYNREDPPIFDDDGNELKGGNQRLRRILGLATGS